MFILLFLTLHTSSVVCNMYAERKLSGREKLEGAKFLPYANAAHPFYVIQLSSRGEKSVDGSFISDALVEHVRIEAATNRPYSHILFQTHGWNTPIDAAIRVPFAQFIGGMLNDKNIPTYPDFRPLFIGITWDSLPLSFLEHSNAIDLENLLELTLSAHENSTNIDASSAANAAKKRGLCSLALKDALVALKSEADDDDEDDEGNNFDLNSLFDAIDKSDRHLRMERRANLAGSWGGIKDAIGDAISDVAEFAGSAFKTVIADKIQHLVFGRLMGRGRRTGRVLGEVIMKLMNVSEKARFSIMGNSLGVQVVIGALSVALPRKIHAAYLVQGATDASVFGPSGCFTDIVKKVAGPVVCTTSKHDRMLKNVFGAFHAPAVGQVGFPQGQRFRMKSRNEFCDSPYKWNPGSWHSVDGSKFINEGGWIEGGHGDFKEDETTMLYWSMIKMRMDDSLYYFA